MRPVLNNGPIRKPSPFISKFISGGGSVPTPDVPVLGTLVVVSDTEITVPYTSDYPVEIWYSTDNVTYTKHGDSASTPYPMTGLTAGTEYYVKARAKNGGKLSEFSSSSNLQTLPLASMWLTADNVNVTGTNITQFNDITGNGYNATPKATAAVLIADKRNGHNAARINETKYAVGGGHETLNIKSIVYVARKQVYIGKSSIMHTGYTDVVFVPPNVTTKRRTYAQMNDGTSYQGVSSKVNNVDKLILSINRKNDADGQLYSYYNNDDTDNMTFTPAPAGKYWNMKDLFEYGGSAENFNGYFYEIMTFTTDLSVDDIASIRNYANNKYKIWDRSSYWYPASTWNNLETLNRLRNVVFFGDSLWTNVADMYTRVGDQNVDTIRGFGYLKVRDNGLYKYPDIRMQIANCTHITSQDSAENWGIQGECVDLPDTGTISVWNMGTPGDEWREDMRFNRAKIYYLKQSSGGSFRYRIDAGDWITVDTSNATNEFGVVTVEISGDLLDHTLYIEGVSGTCRIYGTRTWNEISSGVVFDYVNVGGAAAQEWETYGKYNYDMLADANPDKIFVWLGFNDKPLERTKAQFKSDMESIIDDLKTHCPNADIILLTHHDAGAGANFDEQYIEYDNIIDEYDDALREIQEVTSGVSLIDIDHVAYDRYYGRNIVEIYRDAVHLQLVTGAEFLNNYIIESLYD